MNESGSKQSPCHLLDDFLAGELTVEQRLGFESHLAECPACRDAVADWQALGRTLQMATRELETPSAALVERVQRGSGAPMRMPAGGSKTGRVAALVAAALLAVVLFRELPRSNRPPAVSTSVPSAEGRTTTLVPPPNIQFAGDVIGVPIDIGDPRVTVVWVYPEAKVAQGDN